MISLLDYKENGKLKMLTRTALLLALTLAVQGLRMPPVFTGPIVNFMLILTTALVGIGRGTLIGLFTPWIALITGIIPAPLAPAIPFIMTGNGIYCIFFGLGHKRFRGGSWFGLVVGSLLKFAIIAGAAGYLLALPSPVVEVLLVPQLINALTGGGAAIIFSFIIQKKQKNCRQGE